MSSSYRPPTSKSDVTLAVHPAPGKNQRAMRSGLAHAAKTRSREAFSSLRIEIPSKGMPSFLLDPFEELCERVEAPIPHLRELDQDLRRRAQRGRAKRAPLGTTGARSSQEPRPLEDLDVLGNCFERHVERRGQLGDRTFLARNSAQDFAPRGMSQRMENLVEAAGT